MFHASTNATLSTSKSAHNASQNLTRGVNCLVPITRAYTMSAVIIYPLTNIKARNDVLISAPHQSGTEE